MIHPTDSLDALLSRWRSDPKIGANITAWETNPARPARLSRLPEELHPILADALATRGITSLYSHQAAAWEAVSASKHVIVVTGTASGKTFCYNLPVVNRLLNDPEARALYLFPTKALAHDQLDQLNTLIDMAEHDSNRTSPAASIETAGYDGDTSPAHRQAIRAKARIICTNPDMLHTGILPHHTIWANFFGHLRYVIVDEAHTYRGVFGSHVANVLRRLRRIANFYNARPQFILTSATIANPLELAGQLVEDQVTLIDDDGSAHGARHFLIYNPPIVDQKLGIRRSSLQEGVQLTGQLIHFGVQTIVFGRSRRTVELVLSYLREQHPSLSQRLRGYRSGYLARDRREIEQGLRQRSIDAVVATNALELGIDIGKMGAAVLIGYPGTIASTRQQAGRAGRGLATSAAVLVTSADPIDQFLAHHPEYLFQRTPEHALVDPNNLLILLQHLRCAAFELPFKEEVSKSSLVPEYSYGNLPPETVREFLQVLVESGVVHQKGERFFWMADQYPANEVSLRSASPENILLRTQEEDSWTTIGSIDIPSAPWLVHPDAIYLHESQSYRVEKLDFEHHQATLKPINSDYYTEPISESEVELVSVYTQEKTKACEKHFGELIVTSTLTGYRKIRWHTHEVLGMGQVSLPPTRLQTMGYWLTIDQDAVERLADRGLWSNAPNDYGPDWDRIRLVVKIRDEHRCQMCGALEVGQSFHVHHLTPFRSFHSQEQANRYENLVTLCPTCHRKVETAVRIRSGLAGLAYALGQLAPFLVMCDTLDLGFHSDPQAPLGEGQPTVVIYDHVTAGIGLSEKLYAIHGELIQKTHELVASCECADGCPACVGPAGEKGIGGKVETLALLEELNQTH